ASTLTTPIKRFFIWNIDFAQPQVFPVGLDPPPPQKSLIPRNFWPTPTKFAWLGCDASNAERLGRVRGFNAKMDAFHGLHADATVAEKLSTGERAIANWRDPSDYLP